jgi:hypothetical protein
VQSVILAVSIANLRAIPHLLHVGHSFPVRRKNEKTGFSDRSGPDLAGVTSSVGLAYQGHAAVLTAIEQ